MEITENNIKRFLLAADRMNWSISSLVVHQHGRTLFERARWPYNLDQLHSTHSATKAFTGTAVGLAIGEGLLSLEEKVVDFFRDTPPVLNGDLSPNLQAMTVSDLLTMRSGHTQGVSGGKWRLLPGSWVADFLAQDVVGQPGTRFEYSSANSHILSAIVQRRVGVPIADYLDDRIFRPLGITNFSWDLDPEGISTGGNGLKLSPRDLIKWGVLYLQRGVWNGQQIVPRSWVEQTLIARSAWQVGLERDGVFASGIRDQGYGYQVYSGPYNSFSASGMFGQKCVVYPRHDAVVAINAAIPHHEDSLLIHLIDESLIPNETARVDVPEEKSTFETSSAPEELRIEGEFPFRSAKFICRPNDDNIEWIQLDRRQDDLCLTVSDLRGVHVIAAGLGSWVRGRTSITTSTLHHSYQEQSASVEAGASVCRNGDVSIKCYFVETPFVEDIKIRMNGEREICLDRSVNINDGPTHRPTIIAERC